MDQRCLFWQDAGSKTGIMAYLRTSNGELPITIDKRIWSRRKFLVDLYFVTNIGCSLLEDARRQY